MPEHTPGHTQLWPIRRASGGDGFGTVPHAGRIITSSDTMTDALLQHSMLSGVGAECWSTQPTATLGKPMACNGQWWTPSHAGGPQTSSAASAATWSKPIMAIWHAKQHGSTCAASNLLNSYRGRQNSGSRKSRSNATGMKRPGVPASWPASEAKKNRPYAQQPLLSSVTSSSQSQPPPLPSSLTHRQIQENCGRCR